MKARAIGPCVLLPAGETAGATGRRITYGANLVNPEDACIKWLDTKPHRSVAYVSFGSFASLDAAQTEELARGLLAAGKPFLWVVRATDKHLVPRHLLDEATASGAAMVVPWCPQLDVLAHPAVGCFVTHCGWNSMLVALSYGVPMVAMALWMDQPTNARNVELTWGAGVRARRDAGAGMFLHREVVRCVRAVMDEGEEGSAVRDAARKWRDKARAAVAAGGSSDRNLDEFVQFVCAGGTEKCKALVVKGGEVAGSEM
jgi:UDP-glucose:(indol-3-yl)acetate beta-D-glucosyltransferase